MTPQNDATPGVRFDVRGFARTAYGNHRASLPLAAITEGSLPAESVRMLRYLAVLESSTMEHLRNLLVTATHKDARVTAFLVTWAFEKFWVADALNAVLEANGTPADAQTAAAGARRRTATESAERRGPVRRAILSLRQGVPVVAVHTTSGLIDEWITRIAYERLAAHTASAPLGAIIGRLLEVKQRHAEFFEDESRRRLAESSQSVAQTRRALPHLAWPIGAIDQPASERDFFEHFTFGPREFGPRDFGPRDFGGGEGNALAAGVAARIRSLPGLDGPVATVVATRLLP